MPGIRNNGHGASDKPYQAAAYTSAVLTRIRFGGPLAVALLAAEAVAGAGVGIWKLVERRPQRRKGVQ